MLRQSASAAQDEPPASSKKNPRVKVVIIRIFIYANPFNRELNVNRKATPCSIPAKRERLELGSTVLPSCSSRWGSDSNISSDLKNSNWSESAKISCGMFAGDRSM